MKNLQNLLRLVVGVAAVAGIIFTACSTADDNVKGDGSVDYADDGGSDGGGDAVGEASEAGGDVSTDSD